MGLRLSERLTPPSRPNRPSDLKPWEFLTFLFPRVACQLNQITRVFAPALRVIRQTEPTQEVRPNQPACSRTPRESGQTAPPKKSDLARRHKTGPHRIEMNVVGHPNQCGGVFEHLSLIAALKEMSPHASKTIEPRRIRALQPVHSLPQIGVRRFQRHVVVVAHDHVGMHSPVMPLAGFPSVAAKPLPRPSSRRRHAGNFHGR